MLHKLNLKKTSEEEFVAWIFDEAAHISAKVQMSDVLSCPCTHVDMKEDSFLQISVRTDTQSACFNMLTKF
jgi:hypothetical protein